MSSEAADLALPAPFQLCNVYLRLVSAMLLLPEVPDCDRQSSDNTI